MSSTVERTQIEAGTWVIDPMHSEVSFVVRHLLVSKVRGSFTSFQGQFDVAEDVADSCVSLTIDVASVDTHNEGRDNDLRSSNFFDAERFPTIEFRSNGGVRVDGDVITVEGDLTLRGVTRRVPVRAELNGITRDPMGNDRAGLSASAEISRSEFGMTYDVPLGGSSAVVGDHVKIEMELAVVRQAEAQS